MRYYSEDVVDRIIDDAIQYGIDIDAGGTGERPSVSHYPSVGSNWHTGTPTEFGWYVYEASSGGCYFYFTYIVDDEASLHFLANTNFVRRWQKIEPYRG